MTPDDLRSLCQSKVGPLALAGKLSQLDEATRKSLSKPVQDLYREARKLEQGDRWGDPVHSASLTRLAILACCPWSQAKRVHGPKWRLFSVRSDHWPMAIVKILTDRRPDWASDWVNLQLDDADSEWQSILNWEQVRELLKSGVIERPTSDGYVRMLAAAIHPDKMPVLDDDVIDIDVWRLFNVQTAAFSELPPAKDIDKAAWSAKMHEPIRRDGDRWIGGGGWPRAIYHLAANGRIDRDRLIDAILAALWKDGNALYFSFMVRFHDLLEPAEDEIADREETYRELLRCDYGPAVAMSIKVLGRLHKAKRLDISAFLDAVPAVFEIATKAQPKSALLLIERVARKAEEHRPAAVPAVGAALNHESPDIQEKAVDILAKWKEAEPSLDLLEVVESATMMAPQHRQRLEAVAGIAVQRAAAREGHEQAVDAVGLDEQEAAIRERLDALPGWLRQAACLSNVEESLRERRLPAVFDPPPTDCPVLSGVEPIEPIHDVDELIDVCNRMLSGSGEPEDQERIVDGILRLGEETTDNFEAKTDGLRTTIKGRLEAVGGWFGSAVMWEMNSLPLMIGRWLKMTDVGRVVKTAAAEPSRSVFGDFLKALTKPDIEDMVKKAQSAAREQMTPLDWRLAELFKRLDRGEHGPVLSTPTHKAGWIDPQVFVDRLKKLQAAGVTIGKREFIGGLLRLAPDWRDGALKRAAVLAEPQGRIVRYTLGGDEQPGKQDRDQADEWLAAGRARNPRGKLTELEVLKLSPQEPDGITPATYQFQSQSDPQELKYGRYAMGHNTRCVRVTPDQPGKDARESRPTVALPARLLGQHMFSFVDDARQFQLASIAPLNTDSTLALAAIQLMFRIDDKGSVWEPVNGVMSPLLDADRPWSAIARVALWIGLLSRDDQARGIAIDALIDGIADGRADVGRLGDTLLHIAAGGWMKLNRLADSLREVSRTSLLAERVVSEILDRLIVSWESLPRDGHHVLSLQVELLTTLRQGPSAGTVKVLGGVKGSGKGARLAKQLCQLTTDDASPKMRLTTMEAVEGRMARAERIARYLSASGEPET